jgi:hypothetical protein
MSGCFTVLCLSRRPDILSLMLIGPPGLPGCCPHWDDTGETPSYCALALVMAAVLSGTARPGGEGGAGHGGRRPRRSAAHLPDASDQGRQLGAGGDPELGIGSLLNLPSLQHGTNLPIRARHARPQLLTGDTDSAAPPET